MRTLMTLMLRLMLLLAVGRVRADGCRLGATATTGRGLGLPLCVCVVVCVCVCVEVRDESQHTRTPVYVIRPPSMAMRSKLDSASGAGGRWQPSGSPNDDSTAAAKSSSWEDEPEDVRERARVVPPPPSRPRVLPGRLRRCEGLRPFPSSRAPSPPAPAGALTAAGDLPGHVARAMSASVHVSARV